MSWQIITGLAGGIGLFLLGMQMMTDGLKLSVGNSLREILRRSTLTPLRGILSGALITSMVQSSSAVTVATIGFVNAGLLSLTQAIRVAYGSNLGTTMTGWLVALIGFNFHIQSFALPLIGGGMLMSLFANDGRLQAAGKALAGFGLFFLGIDLMKSGFAGVEQLISIESIQSGSFSELILFAGLGFLMTLIMQSSSAAIAITLTAAAGNVVDLSAAACMVIGANVGTTSTAVLAAIGATPNAQRIAAGHVIFNVVTAVAALLILPLMLMSMQWLQHSMGLQGGTVTLLAMFHTSFNLLGIVLMWPVTERLVHYLSSLFQAAEEDEARPKYLDRTLLGTPSLAHQALANEICRIRDISIRMAEDAINTEASFSPRLEIERLTMDRLIDAVAEFASELRRMNLPSELAETLPAAMAATRYFSDVADLAREIDRMQGREVPAISDEIEEMLNENRRLAISILNTITTNVLTDIVAVSEQETIEQLEGNYESIKARLLRSATSGAISARRMLSQIELLKSTERAVNYVVKGQNALYRFVQLPDGVKEPEAMEAVTDEGSEGDESSIKEESSDSKPDRQDPT